MDTAPLSRGPRFHWLPMTSLGWRAVGLLVAALAFFVLTNIIVAAGQSGPDFNLWIALPIGAAGLSVLLGGATAAFSILRRHERAVSVFAPLVVGLLVALFLIGEFTTPH